jgi:hypothetical protein
MCVQHDQRGLLGLLGSLERGLDRIEVVAGLAEFDDVPPVRTEPGGDVVARREVGRPVDRDLVVVEDTDQPSEAEVSGERCRLVADALHQAAVTGDGERVVVDRLTAESGAQIAFGDRHSDRVGETLTERSGSDLDAGGVADLGMARRRRFPLAECAQVVEFEPVAGQEQRRVLEDRRMPVGEDEAVAVGPVRIGRVVFHHPAVEDVREGRERHPRALVAAVRGERPIHRHPADERDGLRVLFGGQRHAGDSSGPPTEPLRIDHRPG